MKPSSIKSLLLVSSLLTPWLQAQDASAKVREIEQKVLRNQYQNSVQALVGSARDAESGETGTSPELIGKRLQWLAMVNAQIDGGGKTPAANQEDMTESANTLNELAWKMITAPDSNAHHPEIALKLATIALEIGGADPDLKPKVLDTKARALFLLGKKEEAIAEQEKAIAAAPVADEKSGFEATLAAYKRDELPEVSSPADEREHFSGGGQTGLSEGVARIMQKLKTIVIPSIDFEDETLEEAVEFLRKQAIELDTTELDPSRKGLNFVVRSPAASPAPAAGPTLVEDLPNTTADPGVVRIKSLHLRNVPLAVALKYICDATRFRYRVDDFAVTLVLQSEVDKELFTRNFRLPTDFASRLDSGSEATTVTARPPMMNLLKSAGIHFAEGSSLTYTSSGVLNVTNMPSELDKIELLIMAVVDSNQRAKRETPVQPVPDPATPVPVKPGGQ